MDLQLTFNLSDAQNVKAVPDEKLQNAHGQEPEQEKLMSIQELAALRKKLGITQKEIAQVLGYDRTTISNYESGKYPIRNEQAKAYQDFLLNYKNKKQTTTQQMSIQELRALRIKLNISQEQAAKALGFYNGAVRKWENGKRPPRPYALIAYQKFLLDCKNGRIQPPHSPHSRKIIDRRQERTSIDNTQRLLDVQKHMNITHYKIEQATGITRSTIYSSEKRKTPLFSKYYDAIKKYLRQVKLERMFGKSGNSQKEEN